MADNFRIQQDGTGDFAATDEVVINAATVHVPRIKLGHGADGVYDGDVSAANPLPVTFGGNSQPVTIYPSEFARIKAKAFADTEEVRYAIFEPTDAERIYTGVAPDGTSIAATSWTIIQSTFENGNPVRERIRFNVAWSSRESGWT